jgi:AcrR family transcriptional regulator
MKRRRAYRMTARADSTAATGTRIIEAALREFGERSYDDVALATIADAAGVTVQTLLRRYGSKEGLVEAAAAFGMESVRAARAEAPAGDIAAAIRNLAEHYEAWGDRVLRLLAQEERIAAVKKVTDGGRALHHEWVDRVFAPWLARTRGPARARLRAQLIAVTDVYVWKVMRRDLALDARATERAMVELATAAVT